MAGAYYWFPKITGRMASERWGKLNFWLTFIGMNVTFFPMHFLGLDGMPRRIYSYDAEMGWNLWNGVATGGSVILALSIVVFAYNIVRSTMKGEEAGADPWDARTLEWSIPSPPPEYNFAQIPTVQGRDAFWMQKRQGVLAVPVAGGSEDNGAHSIHLPQPSYWPIVASIGLLIGGYGLIYHVAVAAIGGAITLVSTYAWSFEPVNDPDETPTH